MSDGVLVDDAIAWEPIGEDSRPLGRIKRATIGEWSAYVWLSGSCMRPWRAKLRRNENDYRQVRCYRTEEAATARMQLFLRRAAS